MSAIENPWVSLTNEVPRILPSDRDKINALNLTLEARGKSSINFPGFPMPYIGNARSAKVVLLMLNPRFDPDDPTDWNDPEIANARWNNLLHTPITFPFFLLHERYADCGAGKYWRERRLGQLIKDTSLEQVAHNVAVIQWFPYPTPDKSSLPCREICPSQTYSWDLAQRALNDPQRIVVLMRSKKEWGVRCTGLDRALEVNSKRSAYITEGNLDEYDAVVEAVSKG